MLIPVRNCTGICIIAETNRDTITREDNNVIVYDHYSGSKKEAYFTTGEDALKEIERIGRYIMESE